jgi:hypothetical protein
VIEQVAADWYYAAYGTSKEGEWHEDDGASIVEPDDERATRHIYPVPMQGVPTKLRRRLARLLARNFMALAIIQCTGWWQGGELRLLLGDAQRFTCPIDRRGILRRGWQ